MGVYFLFFKDVLIYFRESERAHKEGEEQRERESLADSVLSTEPPRGALIAGP